MVMGKIIKRVVISCNNEGDDVNVVINDNDFDTDNENSDDDLKIDDGGDDDDNHHHHCNDDNVTGGTNCLPPPLQDAPHRLRLHRRGSLHLRVEPQLLAILPHAVHGGLEMMTASSDDVDNDVDVNNVILTISNGDKCVCCY